MFEGAPERPAVGTVYTRPEIVCEVSFTEVTDAGLLRHPVFLGVREDVATHECVAPEERVDTPEVVSVPASAAEPELRLSNLDKMNF